MELQFGSGPINPINFPRKTYRKKNIYLPTEVWVDIFCFPWITRRKMGSIVPKIGNRWFGDQLQFYLHEWGKHSLGHLYISQYRGIGKYPHHGHNQFQPLEYPQTAMPENIKFCKAFVIAYFDNRVFNFFRRIQSLLTADTKLVFSYDFAAYDNVRTILGHLLPLIDGVHTIKTDHCMLPIVKSFPPDKFHQVKVLDIRFTRFEQSAMQTIMEWLASSNSNEPKLLQLDCFGYKIAKQVLCVIYKQFFEATEPATFAVIFSSAEHYGFPAFTRKNAIGEQFVGIRKVWEFAVLRHQANAEAGDQLSLWVDNGGVLDGKQFIHICQPSIERGRIFAMPDLDAADNEEEDKEAEDEKPSTSKKCICK